MRTYWSRHLETHYKDVKRRKQNKESKCQRPMASIGPRTKRAHPLMSDASYFFSRTCPNSQKRTFESGQNSAFSFSFLSGADQYQMFGPSSLSCHHYQNPRGKKCGESMECVYLDLSFLGFLIQIDI